MVGFNSIVLEGLVHEYKYMDDIKTLRIKLESEFYVNNKGHTGKQYFNILVEDDLAEAIAYELCEQRGVRITGRLRNDDFILLGKHYNNVYIVAEHIDLHPRYEKLKKD